MKYYEISIREYSVQDGRTNSDEIYSQRVSEQYAKENPTWLSRVIAVINCLPFPLLTITEPKE